MRWLIYGATGYTGRLLVREAVRRGLDPILAGRDEARLRRLAEPLGLEHRAVRLDDPPRLVRALRGVAVALNAAGPFAATAPPLVAACLAARTHYLDVSGEPEALAAVHRRDREALARQLMLLPGAGFLVVASDCLAAHVAERLPGAVWLRLGFSRQPLASRGSALTVAESIDWGACVRRGGRMVLLPFSGRVRDFDYGRGCRTSLIVKWPDVFTAYFTTGIPNIEAYLEVLGRERAAFLASRAFAGLLRSRPGQALLRAELAALPEGPSARERAGQRRAIVAEVEDRAGRRAVSRLSTPEGYTLTAAAAVEILERALAGDLLPGFQTPGRLYGADFVLGLGGVVREDLEG